ncbi:hypothetical protein, partial [Nonomuraea sp. NPDC049684]|uniref:hypothetical protein n=1 Tax=Nonomuraea sp. NPDC049684 TaxID=3364356 RepID=UPI00378F7B31
MEHIRSNVFPRLGHARKSAPPEDSIRMPKPHQPLSRYGGMGDMCGMILRGLGRVSKDREPVVDGGDVDGGFVADGEFVVPGG